MLPSFKKLKVNQLKIQNVLVIYDMGMDIKKGFKHC